MWTKTIIYNIIIIIAVPIIKRKRKRKLPFKIMYAFCWSCPSATFASQYGGFVPPEWQAAKGLL